MRGRQLNENFHLEFWREAGIEITNAYLYYESKSTGLGEKFFEDLDDCLRRLADNPEQFPRKNKTYREALLTKFPFLVIYEVIQDLVVIYSIFNTWQDPERKP